ncbi:MULTISPECIES: hypothetical protein [Fusobacterium]|jgi:hypothetical protein|uniref:Prepilin-type N-terminal cleavage/methylation domain-containing protein n=1 Tax=Fusobacterium hominis TaxID=2764326 RepID=A0A7G9GWA9_9FUSO|nr:MULTISPECIES: hypothetical protein [Fusobacterium]QNM15091.1 hypothetical protein H9Q81_09275 [Fusobacterium hominis]
MKNKGMMLIEIIIAIALFSIVIFPLLGFNSQLLQINNKLLISQKIYKNYKALQKQLIAKDFSYLNDHIGHYKLTKNNYSFINDIVFPYGIDNFFINYDSVLEIEIIPFQIYSNLESYNYILLKIMYINNNKSLISENFISNVRS